MAASFELSNVKMGNHARILDPGLSCFLAGHRITVGDHTRIDGNVKIEGGLGVTIGAYVHVAWGCHINAGGGLVEIGDHSGMASHAVIIGGKPDLDQLYISAAEPPERCFPIRCHTVIGRFVFVGAGAIILPGIRIGDHAIIGAGAVVTKDVGAREIWYGNPATKQGMKGVSV